MSRFRPSFAAATAERRPERYRMLVNRMIIEPGDARVSDASSCELLSRCCCDDDNSPWITGKTAYFPSRAGRSIERNEIERASLRVAEEGRKEERRSVRRFSRLRLDFLVVCISHKSRASIGACIAMQKRRVIYRRSWAWSIEREKERTRVALGSA